MGHLPHLHMLLLKVFCLYLVVQSAKPLLVSLLQHFYIFVDSLKNQQILKPRICLSLVLQRL